MQGNTLANGTEKHSDTDWNAIDWHQEEQRVRHLRQRIFRATQAGDWKRVRSLQKLMLRSRANRLTSVRRVAQLNTGKKTPGVYKVLLKTPAARGRMVDHLAHYQLWKAKPARRVYIAKANGKLRPLGIPVMIDRCLQAMVKNALEPSWEARFEGCSYGFRPGRGCHDAIEKIYGLARPNKRKKWVLDADIKGAFDTISHEHLLTTIGRVPGQELIKQWLKAGYVDKGVFHENEAGTPQGGVISPLLANIALHGMEEALGIKHRKRGELDSKRALVRYADDFCVFCESQEDAEEAKRVLTDWLSKRGLTLSPEKTKIVHLTEGLNFLGFNIRLYRASNTKTGWKLLTKSSKEAVQKHREKMSCQSRDVRDLLERLEGRLSRAVLRGCNAHSATRLLYKWGRKCTYCGKENIPLQAEHIVPRVKGGSNRISNLCLACEKCNLAKGTKSIEEFRRSKPDLLKCILAQAKAPLKDAAAVNTTRWELNIWLETLGLPIECGSGGLTKYNRTTRELPKTHWLDAACVGKSTPETLQITGVRPLQICANGHGYRQRRGSPMPKLKTKDSPFLPEALGQGSPGSV